MSTLKTLEITTLGPAKDPQSLEHFGTLFVTDGGNTPFTLFKRTSDEKAVRCAVVATKEIRPTPGFGFTGRQVHISWGIQYIFYREEGTCEWFYVCTQFSAAKIQNPQLSAWFDSLVA